HRVDHDPDEHRHRQVDVGVFEGGNEAEEPGEEVAEHHPGGDTEGHPQGEIAFEQAHQWSAPGVLAIWSRAAARPPRSRVSGWRAARASRRCSSRAITVSKARATSAALPVIRDGSGRPQWPRAAAPSHSGQASPAAWSQTVITASGAKS